MGPHFLPAVGIPPALPAGPPPFLSGRHPRFVNRSRHPLPALRPASRGRRAKRVSQTTAHDAGRPSAPGAPNTRPTDSFRRASRRLFGHRSFPPLQKIDVALVQDRAPQLFHLDQISSGNHRRLVPPAPRHPLGIEDPGPAIWRRNQDIHNMEQLGLPARLHEPAQGHGRVLKRPGLGKSPVSRFRQARGFGWLAQVHCPNSGRFSGETSARTGRFWSLAETTGASTSPHGIANAGSFQRTPYSSPGA